MRAAYGVAASLVVALSAPRLASAQEEADGAAEEPADASRVRLGVGYRASYVTDPTFDQFARSGFMPQLSLEATYAAVTGRHASFATGIGWDFGSNSGLFDGFDMRLNVHRFTVPLEVRWHLTPAIRLFGRVAPGAALYSVSVTDVAAPLEGGPWALAVDGSAGASFLLFPHGSRDPTSARVWLTPEVGYGWTEEQTVALEARRTPVLEPTAPSNIGDLTVRGAFVRVALGLAF